MNARGHPNPWRVLVPEAAISWRADAAWLAAAFVVALAARAAYAFTQAPVDWPDSHAYFANGRALLAEGRIESDLVMPLYPALIALAGWDGVRLVQVVGTSALVFVVYGLVRSLGANRVAARIGALLIALEPASIFYANQRLTESTFAVLLAAGLLALYRARPVFGAVLLVTGLLVRPSLDLLLPLLVAVAAVLAAPVDDARRATAARWLAIYALAYLALMAPWWLHNHAKYDRFVRLNLGDGQVARVEQNPVFVAHGFDWPRLRAVQQEFRAIPDPVERNDAYRAAAREFALDDPLRYAALAVRRLGRFWSPVIDQSDPFTSRRVRWPALAFTLLLYGGALGWLLTGSDLRRRWLAASPILLVAAYLTLVHVALHALVRYRYPLTPLLCALAAPGLVQLAAAYRRSREDGSGTRGRYDG